MNYIEIIVLINVVIHYSLAIVAGYISGIKINKVCLFISIILDIIFVLLYIYIPYDFEPYKYLFILLISLMPSINKGIIRCLFYTLIYLMINFSLGGITEIIYKIINNPLSIIISLLLIMIITLFIYVYKKQKVNYDSLMYDVIIKFNKKSVKLKGFCDTGNFLRSDDLIPIVFVNEKYKVGKSFKSINVNTINDLKVMDTYIIDDFKIKIKNKYISKDVYIVYVDIKYDAMFGIDILGG